MGGRAVVLVVNVVGDHLRDCVEEELAVRPEPIPGREGMMVIVESVWWW